LHLKNETNDAFFSYNTTIYTVSQKIRHQTLVHIFAKYRPIFKTLSLAHSAENVK